VGESYPHSAILSAIFESLLEQSLSGALNFSSPDQGGVEALQGFCGLSMQVTISLTFPPPLPSLIGCIDPVVQHPPQKTLSHRPSVCFPGATAFSSPVTCSPPQPLHNGAAKHSCKKIEEVQQEPSEMEFPTKNKNSPKLLYECMQVFFGMSRHCHKLPIII
jgi:hypothetical protein